ncbi:MAG: hypothetical protein LBS21_00455 [Clostridiales bacterium]|jgi:predicted O-linked N-acetylglucosamine transferase (SPINDLY family)|nr:hypothetical protein [Clostridiales bacterium]
MQESVKMLNMGINLAKEEKFEQSVEVLKKAAKTVSDTQILKAVLFQLAICYMRLEKYVEAEESLQNHLKLGANFESYDLLSTLYDITENKPKALHAYKKILEYDKNNEKAVIHILALTDTESFTYGECLETFRLMDWFMQNGTPEKYSVKLFSEAFNTAYTAADKMLNPEKLLEYLDYYSSHLSDEVKASSEYYKSIVAASFSITIYSEYQSNDRQISLMWEIYNLFKPRHVNTFERVNSCFREIKIGFLSSDLSFHPVGRFLLALFKEEITNSGVKYYCYDTKDEPREGDTTDALKKRSDKYTYIGDLTVDEMEKVVLGDELDILFDLNGVSGGNKRELVIRRLAPVQLTWIGFPCTSAIQNVDYIIVDYVTDPTEYAHKFYTEKLAYMSKTFLCYPLMFNLDQPALQLCPPPFEKNGYITFGCFNNALKHTDDMLKAWAEILGELPNSRLMIRNHNIANEIAMRALKARFERCGINLARVDFAPSKNFDGYMSMYNEVDIILDTFPFNGATTTCDAFLMGTPVVSLYGYKHLERVGLDMLGHVSLSDLAVSNYSDFVEKTVELAKNGERLKEIKQTLREVFLASPLCDTELFKVEFESVMRKLHIRYCMENRRRLSRGNLDYSELVSEILRGLYFIESLHFTNEDTAVVNYVKNELFTLQKALIKMLDKGDCDETLEKYKKSVNLFFANVSFRELQSISRSCMMLLYNK